MKLGGFFSMSNNGAESQVNHFNLYARISIGSNLICDSIGFIFLVCTRASGWALLISNRSVSDVLKSIQQNNSLYLLLHKLLWITCFTIVASAAHRRHYLSSFNLLAMVALTVCIFRPAAMEIEKPTFLDTQPGGIGFFFWNMRSSEQVFKWEFR